MRELGKMTQRLSKMQVFLTPYFCFKKSVTSKGKDIEMIPLNAFILPVSSAVFQPIPPRDGSKRSQRDIKVRKQYWMKIERKRIRDDDK